MVDSSSTVGINKSQLVGTHGRRVIVAVFNWSLYLEGYSFFPLFARGK